MKFSHSLKIVNCKLKIKPRLLVAAGLLLVLIPIALLGLYTASETSADWFDDNWHYRIKITIDHNLVSGSADLEDFPFLVQLTNASLAAGAQSDGDDIVFTDVNGNRLQHELTAYNSGTGAMTAWVLLPVLQEPEDTEIYLYYGNPSVLKQENPGIVWRDYISVWHLDETSNGSGAVSRADSGPSGNTLTDNGTTASGTGKVDNAADFEKGDTTFLSITDGDQRNLDLSTSYTISFWMNVQDDGDQSSPLYQIGIYSKLTGTSGNGYYMRSGYNAGNPPFRWYNSHINGGSWIEAISVIDDDDYAFDTWAYMTIIYDDPNNTYTFCKDAVCGSPHSMGVSPGNSTGDFVIGKDQNIPFYMDGLIDEFRVQSGTVTVDRMTTEYNMMNDPTSYITVGTQENSPGPIAFWKFDEGADNSCPGGEDACDSTSNQLDGTFSGTVTWTTESGCVFGKCIQLNGTTGTVNAGDQAKLSFERTDTFTLQAWIKTSTDASMSIIAKQADGAPINGYNLQTGTGGYIFLQLTNTYDTNMLEVRTTNDMNYDDGNWHHVAATYDGTSGPGGVVIYFDGIAQSLTTVRNSLNATIDNSTAVHIGSRNGAAQFFNGYIDEAKIYDEVRTADEIKVDYTGGAARLGAYDPDLTSPLPDLVSWWRFDEGSGDTANTAVGTVNGNLAGASNCPGNAACPSWVEGKHGRGLSFDGGDYLALTSATPVQTASKTITFWAKPDGNISSNQLVFSLGSLNYYVGFSATNEPQFSYVNASAGSEYWDTDLNIAVPDEWHHYAFVMDVNGMTVNQSIYVDGVLRASRSDNDGVSATYGSNAYIGSYDGTIGFYSGDLDEVKFYDSALSAGQVAIDMNANSAVSYGVMGSSEASLLSDGAGDGPVGYWPMDENTDNTCSGGSNDVCDKSGNANDGANNNGPVWKPGKYGASLDYDGGSAANDYTEINDNANLQNIFDGGGTVEAWIYPRSDGESDYGVIVQKTFWQVYVQNQSGSNVRLRFWKGFDGVNDGNWYTPAIVPINTWTHVAVVYSSDSAANDPILYINGSPVTITEEETPVGSRVSDSGPNLLIGNYHDNTRTFDGRIDEVKLYNYARTPAQIAYGYNRGGPLAWWKMDECTDTNIRDASGNGIDGTIYANAGTNTAAGTCVSGITSHMRYNGRIGRFDTALDFDGADDFVSMGDDNLLDFADGRDFSISGWFYRDTATTDDTILAKRNGIADTDDGYILYIDDSTDRLTFEISDSSDTDEYQMESTSTFTGTGWYFFAVVWDESSAANSKIYINAVDDNETHTGTIGNMGSSANAVEFYLGAESDGGGPFDGKLDDVRVFNYALSEAQVRSLLIGGGSARYGPATGRP